MANGGVAYPNAPNPTTLPPPWSFDAFVETKVTPKLSIKLYAKNLFSKTYDDCVYQGAQPFIAVARVAT